MIWIKHQNDFQGDKLKDFYTQTVCDLKALLLAALAGVVMALVIAVVVVASLSMTSPA